MDNKHINLGNLETVKIVGSLGTQEVDNVSAWWSRPVLQRISDEVGAGYVALHLRDAATVRCHLPDVLVSFSFKSPVRSEVQLESSLSEKHESKEQYRAVLRHED